MADIPDYMRGFDLDNDWGFTPVSTPPTTEEKPTIDPKTIDNQSLEFSLDVFIKTIPLIIFCVIPFYPVIYLIISICIFTR